MNLKELDQRIDEILKTEYHSIEILNMLIQRKEIEKLLAGENANE